MKENEFDIYVRDLLAGAEESVSPDVWKGVEAGLDKAARRRRVVPVWAWRSIAGVAAAAAAVAGVLFLVPDKHLSNQPTIQTVAQATDDAPLPAATLPEEEIVPVTRQVSRIRNRQAYVLEVPAVEVPEETVSAPETAETESTRKPDTVIAPGRTEENFSADDEALRQLAFEEHKTRRRGHYSVGVAGNLQSNTRPDSPVSTIRRSSGLFVDDTPDHTGLFGERPEFSFGLPVSAGLNFRYDFNPRWGIGTGLVYTNLSRSFMANYAEVDDAKNVLKRIYDTDVTNQQHYLGVPLDVYFNIVNTGNWNVHVRMGGMAERLIDNHFLIHDSEGDIHLHEKVDPLQLSAGVGVGLEFKFTPYLGIYLDPTLRYYFDNGQPRSLRTIQPLRFDLEAGLRFTLGR